MPLNKLPSHDFRIPLTGRNINFQHDITGNKPHILVLNKKDLVFNPGSDGKNHQSQGFLLRQLCKRQLFRQKFHC